MKKVIFNIKGRQFNVELDDIFAQYIENDLSDNEVYPNRDCNPIKLLQLYLKAMKRNFDNEEQIRTFMTKNLLEKK